MAKWPTDPSWVDLSDINKGNTYLPADGLIYSDVNKIVTNSLYVKKKAEQSANVAQQAQNTATALETDVTTLKEGFTQLSTKFNSFKATTEQSFRSVESSISLVDERLSTDLATVEKRVANLESSASDVVFTWMDDDAEAVEKIVPGKASPYAMINRVGTVTRKTLVHTGNFATSAGQADITYGTLKLSFDSEKALVKIRGIAPGNDSYVFQVNIPADKYYTAKTYVLTPLGGSASTPNGSFFSAFINSEYSWSMSFESTEPKIIQVHKDDGYPERAVLNFVLYIRAGDTFYDYQLQVECFDQLKYELVFTDPVAIVSMSRNLIPFNNDAANENYHAGASIEKSGITFTTNEDGSVHIKGTATDLAQQSLTLGEFDLTLFLPKGTYAKGSYDGINEFLVVSSSTPDGGLQYYTTETFTLERDAYVRIYLQVLKGTTVDKTIYPQVERGTVPTAYTQFGEVERIDIPEELRSLYYFRNVGISSKVYNYISFEDNGVYFIKNCDVREYTQGDYDDKTVLTDGVYTIYPLAVPQKLDISEYIKHDGLLRIDPNSSIQFINTPSVPTLSSITYQISMRGD